MSTLFTSGAGGLATEPAANHLTLAEKSKIPTAASQEVLLAIESRLDLLNIASDNSLFKREGI